MRSIVPAALLLATLAMAGCKPREVPSKPDAAAPADAGAAVPVASDVPAAPAHDAATQPAPDAGGGERPGANLDKDKLSKCYTEVYCAQKKGEMDKILEIYKRYGFNNPQEFTKTWIEAAKDTDWITKIAHEVGKKCQ